jgi:hypothetical protein
MFCLGLKIWLISLVAKGQVQSQFKSKMENIFMSGSKSIDAKDGEYIFVLFDHP